MKTQSAFLNLAFLFLVFSCSAQQPLSEITLGDSKQVLFLDAHQAAAAITRDATDGFFEKVTAAEISIQMKKPLRGDENLDALREEYIEFLKTDVEDFTAAETKFIAGVMEGVFKTCESVSKDIFPAELKLIKTTGRHYGNSVYYTRENCIVIPKNELEDRDERGFTSTMYHELFHVYSRLNAERSRLLYSLIGFEPIGFQNLRMPDPLAQRLLFNPDGVDFAQKITLRTKDNTTIHAIPIISSTHTSYVLTQAEFFSYLSFNLYQVVPEGSQWTVVTKPDGFSSTLDLKTLPDFFRQIKDNTHYIIHPDEVLADNFSFIMMAKNDPTVGAKFSPEGKQLLSDVETILKGGNPLTKDGRTPGNGSNR